MITLIEPYVNANNGAADEVGKQLPIPYLATVRFSALAVVGRRTMIILPINVTTPASQIMPRPGMKKPRSQEPRRAVVLLCLRRQLAPCGAFLLASVKLPCTTTTQRCAAPGFKVYAVSRFTAPVSPLNVRFSQAVRSPSMLPSRFIFSATLARTSWLPKGLCPLSILPA